MTKKEMIDILVDEQGFNKTELNEMSKNEVEELFTGSEKSTEKVEEQYGVSENTFGIEDKEVEESPSKTEPKLEEEKVEEKSKLGKAELRILRRKGKL